MSKCKTSNRRGRVIVISGPSGVGKTTICNRILEAYPGVKFSISATSRPKRRDEKNGREYIFLTKRKFKAWINKRFFIEHATVHNNLYGTPKKPLEENLDQGYNVLLDIDVQGAKNLMRFYHDGLYFFLRPPDIAELKRRLLKRNTDMDAVIEKRLANARKELKYKNDFGYVIENRDLKATVKKVLAIIEKETKLNR